MYSAITTTQFYLFGKKHCTRTGWLNAKKGYKMPDILESKDLNLTNKVYMITGANAGIGKEISTYLASKNATVYMVCRNYDRAKIVLDSIKQTTNNDKVYLLIGDCGLEKDIRRIWKEFLDIQSTNLVLEGSSDVKNNNKEVEEEALDSKEVRLDALICNAGALLNQKSMTEEGVEVTFATHLLFGTYLLGSLALPVLEKNPDSRLIVVSSGGMYNSKFPTWDIATSTGINKYDGQYAYVYAKRGQVLLCEQWAETYKNKVKVVSCHPGWTLTEGVESAYGESKKYLEPLRSLWEGAEGIIWLAVGPKNNIEDGAFYLDRKPQIKHMGGLLFSKGSYTKNSPEEVITMMQQLAQWSDSQQRPFYKQLMINTAKKLPLVASEKQIDLQAYMGDWYVLANIPTYFEVGATNCIEKYRYDSNRKVVRVTFQYAFTKDMNKAVSSTTTSEVQMRGTIVNEPINTHWKVDPKVIGVTLPLHMDNLVLDVSNIYDELLDMSTMLSPQCKGTYAIIGVPDRSYLWIMTRSIPSQYLSTTSKVTDAYPQLMTNAASQTITTTTNINNNNVPSIESTTILTQQPEQQQQQPEQLSEDDQKVIEEILILRKAIAKADELGYDTSKIMRCAWNNELVVATIVVVK